MGGRRGHGEGSIYRRESADKWCIAADLGWIDGKRKRKVVRRDQQRSLPIATERQTVGQFLDRGLAGRSGRR